MDGGNPIGQFLYGIFSSFHDEKTLAVIADLTLPAV
jgi:hypothetical protein